MKFQKTILTSICLLFALQLSAQATLPTTWNMGDANNSISNPPAGWSYKLDISNGNLVYTGAGFFNSAPQGLRLDGSGEYLQINFAGRAQDVTFYVRSTAGSGFAGQFDLQESTDGNSWNTVNSWNNSMPNALTKFTFALDGNSRFVRFIHVTKGTGSNVALDDVTITPRAASSKPEIVLSFKNKVLVNNSEIFTGNDSIFKIKVKNNGTSAALIINPAISSGQTTSFSILNSLPINLVAKDSTDLQIKRKTTVAQGSHKAVLNILSNDSAGNNNININLYSIFGNLASEPLNQISGTVTRNAWSISPTLTSPSENILVLINQGGSVTEKPVDGMIYQKGAYIGSSRIVHVGPAAALKIDKIIANTNYQIKVFPFNGQGGFENYFTDTAFTINTTTPGLAAGNYYSGISSANNTFVADIRSKVRPHFQVFYSNYATTIINNFEAYDTTANRRVLECYYSGYKYLYVPPFKFDTMSREHAYPFSWMGEGSQDSANYSDLHILFPVNQENANAIRSNFVLNDLKTVSFTFLKGRLGTDSNGNVAYEPRNEVKGQIARANFYICATYNRPGKPFTIPTSVQFVTEKQDQNVLKRWNLKYPPSNKEIARQEYIASVQNNRNPFIDNPNWACFINFSNMTYEASGNCNQTAGNNSLIKKDVIQTIQLFPNPSVNLSQLDLSNMKGKSFEITVVDMTEKTVLQINSSAKLTQINTASLASGVYLVMAKSNLGEWGFVKLEKK